jgi:hypothetical protein
MPYGQINADVIQSSVSGVSLGAGNATVFKNRIINGDMRIDQRNAGASVTPANNQYTLDRFWASLTQSSKFTVQQNAGSVTPPVGFINYLGVTSSSAYSVASGDLFIMAQNIEGLNVADLGWGTANAKTITLSFQVYSSLTGTFGGSIVNNGSTRSYPFTYTISSANTWTTATITIAGDTSGTWLTTNGVGIRVYFNLGSGSTYSGTANAWGSALYTAPTGAVSVVGTNGATWYVTGVQLEVGSSATGFEYNDYGCQLIQCQRYYQQIGGNSSVGTANYTMIGAGQAITGSQADIAIPFKVTMRSLPTLAYSGNFGVSSGSAFPSVTSITDPSGTTQNVAFARLGVASGLTAGYGVVVEANNSSTSFFSFSSEL